MAFVAAMPAPGANQMVEISKGLGGNRTVRSGQVRAVVFPVDLSGRGTINAMAQRYRYGLQLPPGFALIDGDGKRHEVAMGDTLLCDRWPEQDLELSEPVIESIAAYGHDVITFYFMELTGGQQVRGR